MPRVKRHSIRQETNVTSERRVRWVLVCLVAPLLNIGLLGSCSRPARSQGSLSSARTQQGLSGSVGPTDVVPGTTAITSGRVNDSHSVGNSGQLQYSIPLWVVPGRLGMEPGLSIDYSSGGATTHLGRGFRSGANRRLADVSER